MLHKVGLSILKSLQSPVMSDLCKGNENDMDKNSQNYMVAYWNKCLVVTTMSRNKALSYYRVCAISEN